MSIEDLNVSAIDADQAVTEFSSEIQADDRQTADIEMAQATDNGASAKSDRLPTEAAADGERPKEIVPDQNNIARLPANVTVDEIRVEGANLILVQADGTEVTIINGALRIPTFIIGDVEVPQQVLLAVLEQDGVNVAAGPDGSYSATSSGPQSSGGDFDDSLQQSNQEAGPLADLLANTEFDDPNGDGNGLLFDDTPIITETALSFVTETANADGTFENQTIDGIFGFVPGTDTGEIASIAYVNTLNIDEPTQTGIATALTSGGVAVIITVSADGLTLTGTAGGTVVFTLTVSDTATGAFTFQQLHALDHPDQGQSGADDLLRLQFSYTVTDKDGDTVIGNASIDIRDDGPVANVGTGSTVEDEAVNGGNNEADGLSAGVSGVSLNINWGADNANAGGLNDRSVVFTDTTVAVSGASSTALTSLGLAVSTVLIGGVLVGYTGETPPTAVTGEGSGNVVFFASVSDAANGTYDFTLVKPLDHAAGNGENSLSLTFNYTATDSDGDKSSNTFTVNVLDDAPVANVGTGSTVEDEAVNGGNNEADGLSAGVSGVSLNINWGADNANAGGLNDRSVVFTDTTVAVSGASSTALTSLGLAVSTVLIGGVLVGYTGETPPTAVTGEGSGNVVFFASVSDAANGTYDFTLVKPLDHAAGNGENSLSLTFNYTATDSDGDKSSNTFTVNVVDDAPVANVGTGSTVEDEAVNGGNNEADGLSAGVSGVSLNINWGADNANAGGLNDRSVVFTDTTVAVSGASSTALTSLGLAVSTVLIGGVLVGYTGETPPTAVTGEGSGNVVFFASVSDAANGTYDFTLVKPLDHAAGNGENSLSLTFNYTATDSDGDKSSNTFTVNVLDDAPVANVGTGSTVEDEAVNGGNNEADGLSAGVSGVSLNINWGADNANAGGLNDRSVVFTDTTVAVSGASSTALTSLGLAVSTVLIGGVLVGYTGETPPTAVTGEGSGNVVFFASVSDAANGTYDFTLVKPLDHAAGNGENSLSLTFNYTATDSDGDKSSNTFTVNVVDDAPVANVGTGSTVEDEAVNGGNNEADGLSAGVSGVSLNINWGADNANAGGLNDRSVVFTDTTVAVSGASSTALTSLGLAVSTVLIGGVLVGYTGETPPTAVTGEGSGNVVFFASVSDAANGTYDFTLVKPLDHAAGNGENSLSLTFNYTATDSDGDKSSNTFTVNVVDDAPVANVGTGSTVEDEAVNGGNNEADGLSAGVSGVSLNINWGADNANAGGLNDRSVVFTDTTVAVSGASSTALTSLGLAVSTVLIGGVLVGYTGETPPTAVTGEGSGNVVFFASVSDAANGTYDFTLVKPLDHAAGNGENSLSLTFNYTATDSDGDKSSNTFTVNVLDDAPVANVGTGSTVEDEAVNGGNNEADGLSAGVSGVSLNINWGADNANAGGLNDRSVVFTDTTVAVSGASSTALTSLGLAVSTVLIGGVLVGYTGETPPTAVTGEGSGNVVFFASVSDAANGTYDFTLVKPLDHAAGNGENSLSLTFNYTATDSDGDKSSNTFTVNVVDDAPVANVGTGSTVEDEAVNGGNNEADGLSAGVSGVSLNINWGADNANAGGLNDRSVVFTDTTVAVSGASSTALTSLGLAVSTVLIGGVLVGYTGETPPTAVTGEGSGNVVFFASVSDAANGTYDFTLVKPLDHAAGNGENSLSLTFNYTATDSDGDKSSNTFTVNVVDDAPVANVGTGSTVEDEAVNGGNNEADGLSAGVSGVSLNINWGADNANAGGLNDRSVVFTDTTVAVSGASSTALTSLGLAVSTVLIGGVLVGYTGETPPTAVTGEGSGNVVFFASVSDAANGTYDFTLVKPLDHAAGNGENSLSLTFNYTATDSDGDKSSNTFTVNVVDDAPVANVGTGSTVEDEAVNGGNNEADGLSAGVSGVSLNINWGADNANAGGLNDRSVVFTDTTVAVSGASSTALTSLGLAVSTVLIGGVLVGYTGETPPTAVTGEGSGNVVFFASVSDAANGTYDFTLVKPLDHAAGNGENSLSLTFNYTATDSDGDKSSNTFTVNVVDDAPVANVGTGSTVEDEAVNGGNNEADGLSAGVSGVSLNINWGADNANAGGLNDRSVVFTDTTVAVSGASSTALTSLGLAVSTVLIGGVLVGYTGETPPTAVTGEGSGNVVFFASVSDAANGTYDFTLVKPLDHAAGNGENSLSLTFNYTATDSDGDKSSNTFTVNVVDDIPVLTGTSIGVTTDEGDIYNLRSQGTSPNDGTADGSSSEFSLLGGGLAATVSGSVASTVAFGADGQQAGGGFSFTSDALATLNGLGLTSKGGAIVFAVVDGAIVGYVNGAFGGFQPLIDRPVMSLELNETTGAFTFRQYDQLDHAAGNGQNTTLANGLASINFGAVINATDGDGDVINLSGKLLITVRDDVPEVSISTVGTVTIDETSGNQNDDTTSSSVRNLFNGVTGKGSDSDLGGAIYARHDVVNTSVNGGTDDAVTTSLTLRIDSAASGLFTTDGQAITLSLEGGLVVGRIASGEAAFAIAIQPDGNVSVAQYLSLAHPNSGSNDEAINLAGKISAVFTATDYDGDVVPKSISIGDKISFEDDGPRVFANTLVKLDDDALAGGNPGGNGDDVNAAALTGTLAHDGGADGTASVLWSGAGLTLPAGFWFTVSTDGTVMTITQLQNGVYVPVVTATITNTATGAYSVAQIAPIDHPQGTIPGTEDNVQFTVSYDVTDGDGDQVRGTLSINVDDDTPTVGANTLIQLDDDSLAGGSPGGVDDDAASALLSGVLSHNGGADGTASVLWASNGLTLPNGFWYDLSADSKTMTITQLQNGSYVAVFKAVITDPATGAYQITQLAPVNHNTAGREDNVQISFQYQATDGDGDVATGTLSVNVDDDTPTIPETATQRAGVSDDALAGGNLEVGDKAVATGTLSHSFGADGGSLSWQPSTLPSGGYTSQIDGNTFEVFQSQNGVAVKVFGIVLDPATGAYTLTQFAAIKHPNGNGEQGEGFNLNYRVTDGDGDYVQSFVRVVVGDDTPTIPETATQRAGINDDALAGGNVEAGDTSTATGTLSHSFGADGGSLSWQPSTLPSGGYTSQINGNTLEVFQSQNGVAVKVFGVVLNPATGAYTLTQFAAIKHPNGNAEQGEGFDLNYRVTDGDGDYVQSFVRVVVGDDTPTIPATVTQRAGVSDDALAGGNPEVGDKAVATGTLSHSFGADGGSLSWQPSSLPSGGYTSQINGNTMEVFQSQNGVSVKVFGIVLNPATGAYTLTQFAAIKHPNGNGEQGEGFDLNYRVTDGDGDYVQSFVRVVVGDDVPVVTGAAQIGTLSEAGLPLVSSTFGSLNINIGADSKNTHVAIGMSNGAPIINAGLTSDGVALQYIVRTTNGVDQELVAFKQGDPAGAENPVFIVSVLHPGSFAATLYQNIDHAPGDGPLALNLSARVYDGDGDYVDQPFTISIADDIPTASYSGNVAVTEDVIGTVFAQQTVSGRFIFDGGADGAKVTSLAYGAGSNAIGVLAYDADAAGPGVTRVQLTSAGRPISVETSADGLTLTGKTATGVTVFTLHVDNALTAEYTFKQFAPMDHPDVNETGAADPLRLRINFTVTDGDGDTASGHIQVDIRDDAPVAISAAQTGTLSESGLISAGISLVSGNLNVEIGADNRNTHVEIGMSNGAPIINAGLTSDGVALQYIVRTTNGVDQELVAFKQGDPAGAANPVFIVSVLHPGSFVATLYQNLDHAPGNDPLALNLSARVYDGDGDYVDQPFTINIADTVPVPVTGASVSGDVAEGTLALGTQTFASSTVDLAIPGAGSGTGGTNTPPITSTIVVPAGGTIHDLNISINLSHTFMDDLEITLIAPDGTRIRLVNDNGGASDPDGVMTFDDEAANPFPSTSSTGFVGTWKPAIDALSLLDGKNMSGTWTLEIKDDAAADIGTLHNWSLGIETLQLPVASTTTVNLSPLVSVGADDINGGAAFVLKTITTAENLGTVMAGGQQVKIVSDGTTLTGYAANDPSTPLFSLKVSATGIATFVLFGELDHGVGRDTLKLDLSAYVQARDGDGDTITLGAGQFFVNVADSLPTATNLTVAMSENESKSITLTEGVHFNFGADEIGKAFSFGTPSYTGLPVGITLGTPAIAFDTVNHKVSIVPGTAFDALAVGQTVVMHIPYTVADGDGDTVTKDIAITITGTNDIPVIDVSTATAGNDTTITVHEQTPMQFAWQADLSDVDSPTLQSMTLTLGHIQDGTAETLSLNATATAAASGLTVSYNTTTGVMQINGVASINTYETILKNIVYLNSSDNPHVATDRTVTVVVNDGIDNSTPHVANIHLIALNDAPALAGSLTETVAEGASVTLTLAKLGYTDPDDLPSGVVFQVSNLTHGTITNGGASATSFTAAELIAGLIKFNHDGSEGPTASFNVKVEDGNEDGSVPVVGTFNLTVTQVNDLPTISSGSTGSEAENSPIANVVYQTLASDVDPGSILTYSLTGADASRFNISSTGAVTFKASPNFEVPTDAGGNNVYDIIVNVTDGVSPAVTKAVAISVTNVNEAPVITSGATGSEAENTAISNVVYQTVASDPEGVALTYSLTGADASLFNISSTGAVTFKASPNFEVPTDAGGNNVYNFTVNGSDGVNTAATKDVAVTVTDVVENVAPVGVADRIFTNASNSGSGTVVEFDHAWLLSNDADANGDSLTINSYGWTSGSGVEIVSSGAFDNGNTQIVVDLNGGASGSFNYSATDGIASTGGVAVAVQRSSDNELILGGAGDDILIDARSSEAVLDGRGGRDYIIGGNSDNTIVGDQNDHLINGGGGTDTVSVGSSFTSSSNAQIVNVERFTLTSATTLNVSNQSEGFKILGSSGADTITGGGGNDTINGGGGSDTINLSAANSDQDQIRFATNTGSDTVNGFIAGEDKIAFLAGNGSGAVNFDDSSGSSAGTTLDDDDFEKVASIAAISSSFEERVIVITTAQTETQILAATNSADKSYVVVYNSTAGAAQIWFDTNWGSANSRSLVATLNGVTAAQVAALTRADFVAYNSATDPIILDLDHNGFAFSSIENGVTFDINADGKADKVAWTSKDGILAYDVDGNGKIDNGSEIFTPSFAGGNHAGGVAALATLDGNGDGKIDADDDAFSKLSIWVDANNNGISDAGELSNLADNHVASISLGATSVDGQEDGQSVLAEGTFTLDNGKTGDFIEVGFDTIVGDGSFGTAGDDILAGGLAHYSMTGGAGADTFVLDADAFNGIDLADVITDYKAGDGDVLDVSSLLTSLLGHDASEADALAGVKTTVSGADTVVSVNDNGAWHDVAVLQDYTSTVKILYDDDHNATAVSHTV